MSGGQLSAKVVSIAERRLMALQLRKQGGSFRQIAAQLRKVEGVSDQYSEAQAHRDVKAELARINRMCRDEAEECLRLELERLDDLFARYWPLALKGASDAADRCMAIMRRQGDLLRYNPSAKVQVGGIPEEEGGAPIRVQGVDYRTAILPLAPPADGLPKEGGAGGAEG